MNDQEASARVPACVIRKRYEALREREDLCPQSLDILDDLEDMLAYYDDLGLKLSQLCPEVKSA